MCPDRLALVGSGPEVYGRQRSHSLPGWWGRAAARLCLLLLLTLSAGGQQRPAVSANLEAAFEAASRGDLRGYAGYIVGAGEALEREPGTLGEETPESVMAKGANLLIARAEQHRAQGHARKFFDYLQSSALLLETLRQREPDQARWHYYKGLQRATLGSGPDLERALEAFQTCLNCSNAAEYRAAARRQIAWCKAEQQRQKAALRRQQAQLEAFLRSYRPAATGTGGSDYVPCDCRGGWTYAKGAGGCPACR